MKTQRLLALLCLALSFPSCFFFLPWLPLTIQDHFRILHDLQYPGATVSYYSDRHAQLHSNYIALFLYAVGIFALLGLVGIVAHRCRLLSQRLVWFASCATGVGIALFWQSGVGPQTTAEGLLFVTYLPLAVAILACLAFFMSFVVPRPLLPPTHPNA